MAAPELGLMSQKEVSRLEVVRQVRDGGVGQAQAAQLLGLSIRQVKRLCRRVREHGAEGLIPRRRGQPSHRRIAWPERERFMAWVRKHYADFGPQLAHEYLRRRHANQPHRNKVAAVFGMNESISGFSPFASRTW